MTGQELIICKGLPASGKSTYAKKLAQDNPKSIIRVSRDDLRHMCGKYWVPKRENLITEIEDSIIVEALEKGYDVIVDATNLRGTKRFEELIDENELFDVSIIVKDFTHVSLTTCIERDLARGKSEGKVGVEAIVRMWNKYLAPEGEKVDKNNMKRKYSVKRDPRLNKFDGEGYIKTNPDISKSEITESCFIFDLDGTLALMNGRSPYDGEDCNSDILYGPVAAVLKSLAGTGYKIIILSGRNGESEKQTKEWLSNHSIYYDELHMRKPGDMRKDTIVKNEMWENHIKGNYNVIGIFDDRDMMVEFWRNKGFPCFQVYWGDF